MRTLLAVALLCAPACAAPVPKELRKPPVEKEPQQPEDLLSQFKNNKFLLWQVSCDRIDMPLRTVQDKPVNGTSEPNR